MNIFLTNASGYVGSAVAEALCQRGHQVSALARHQASIAKLSDQKVLPVPGELGRPESILRAAIAADVVVHTAFEYFPDGSENADLDTTVTRALIEALGQHKRQRLIYTSNAYLPQVEHEALVPPHQITEPDEQTRAWRLQVERLVVEADSRALSTAVIRLGMVYGGQGGGTIADLLQTASRAGILRYPEHQAGHHWSLIARPDLAMLYACLCEQWQSGVYHGVDGTPLTVASVCQIVAAHAQIEAVACPGDSPDLALSTHARHVMTRDRALQSTRSRTLGWQPRYRSLATGIDLCVPSPDPAISDQSCARENSGP